MSREFALPTDGGNKCQSTEVVTEKVHMPRTCLQLQCLDSLELVTTVLEKQIVDRDSGNLVNPFMRISN